jgi:hypothetical protein
MASMANVLDRIWLYPPLAFARVGSGTIPVPAFQWGPSDNSPRGSGKTTIVACETLDIDESGVVSSYMPEQIAFKEVVDGKEVFRPVCPWYELHGQWTIDGKSQSGPITAQLIEACGIALRQVRWEVKIANRKAYNMTLRGGDVISATLSIHGDDFTIQPLLGISSAAEPDDVPLVPHGSSLPLGQVQLANPVGAFSELRLRITPPIGAVYGPKGVRDKIARISQRFPKAVAEQEDQWDKLQLPPRD